MLHGKAVQICHCFIIQGEGRENHLVQFTRAVVWISPETSINGFLSLWTGSDLNARCLCGCLYLCHNSGIYSFCVETLPVLLSLQLQEDQLIFPLMALHFLGSLGELCVRMHERRNFKVVSLSVSLHVLDPATHIHVLGYSDNSGPENLQPNVKQPCSNRCTIAGCINSDPLYLQIVPE